MVLVSDTSAFCCDRDAPGQEKTGGELPCDHRGKEHCSFPASLPGLSSWVSVSGAVSSKSPTGISLSAGHFPSTRMCPIRPPHSWIWPSRLEGESHPVRCPSLFPSTLALLSGLDTCQRADNLAPSVSLLMFPSRRETQKASLIYRGSLVLRLDKNYKRNLITISSVLISPARSPLVRPVDQSFARESPKGAGRAVRKMIFFLPVIAMEFV